MLRITVDNKPRVLTFRLEGRLAGPWLRVLEECWQSNLAHPNKPILCVDLTGVTFIDPAGKDCLAILHREGAAFIAADCQTKAIVDEITRVALPDSGPPDRQRRTPPEADMSDNQRTAWDRDTRIENFAAELTRAVYPIVL